ncbi:hypothetical protein PROFUN_07478 [Planoprotostelium fungivorum]|uniref:Uncharacterized protein n=1 Tax=Planoprotostelium fungivorum TaxID=1890364 RepID=A0A2P6NLJ2_9EUKA|nr:hypothetical protein PROFUN_07478 [Planoprotostelium fungivorum]
MVPFRLMEPLRGRQRKSYDRETRFISPRPVVILSQDSELVGRIQNCVINVQLCDGEGSPLSQEHISGPHGVEAVLSLTYFRTPPLALKISHLLEDQSATLSFDIECTMQGGQIIRANIMTDPFVFIRDRKPRRGQTRSASPSSGSD